MASLCWSTGTLRQAYMFHDHERRNLGKKVVPCGENFRWLEKCRLPIR
jgi:hypothetical protein